jgi:hypothetical protein
MHLVEDLLDLHMDTDARRKHAGELIDACPLEIAENIRIMLTDQQLMGEKLSRIATRFEHLSMETARVFKKEGASEKFIELASMKSSLLSSLLYNTLISDADPLSYVFFEMLMLQAFR